MTDKPTADSAVDSVYDQYLASLLEGDRTECADIVENLHAGEVSLRSLYVDLFQRALYRVGDLWEQNRVSVATEHLATAITERMVALVEPRVFGGQDARRRSIVVACVADEYHQLGGRMAADLFELYGWRAYFLGANTPHQSLLDLIEKAEPELVGLSLSIYSNLPSLLAALDAVRAAHPALPIIVGGQAFRWGGEESLHRYQGVTLVKNTDDLERIADAHANG